MRGFVNGSIREAANRSITESTNHRISESTNQLKPELRLPKFFN